MQIRPVGAESSHADGQTDMTKLIAPFHNFANAPKNQSVSFVQENYGCFSEIHIKRINTRCG
jgi:hypothetical protein